MSNDVTYSQAGHTRRRSPKLVRQSLKPITERMRRSQSGSTEDLHGKPVKSSPRSPGRNRKSQSAKPSESPKNLQHPDITKQKRLYPRLDASRDDEDDEEDADSSNADENDEIDNVSYDDDSLREEQLRRYPARIPGRRPRGSPGDARHERGQDRHRREPNTSAAVDKDSQTQFDLMGILILVVAIVAIVIGVSMFHNQSAGEEAVSESVDYFKLYQPHLEKIRRKYPSQTTKFWRVVNSAIRRLLTEKVETYPAVLLLGIPDGSSATGTCLSKEIVKSLNDMFNSSLDGYISSGSLNSDSPGKLKVDLDEKLMRNLEHGKGVVLDHIEKLPAQAALLLHGYCDGDNAPYKSAAIVLGLHVASKQIADQDDAIENILNDLWEKDLGVDEMPALRSRIANSITVVNQEPDVKC